MDSIVDWNGKLEVVHGGGAIEPIKAADVKMAHNGLRFANLEGGNGWVDDSGRGTIRDFFIRNVAPKEVEWGPEIKVEGKRPEWLGDEDQIMIMSQYGAQPNWNSYRSGYDGVPWGTTTFIKLKANHPHYTTPTRTALEQRMEDCLKALAAEDIRSHQSDGVQAAIFEARAILAELEPADPVDEAFTTLDVWLAGYTSKADEAPVTPDHDDDLLTFGHLRAILTSRGRALERGE